LEDPVTAKADRSRKADLNLKPKFAVS